MSAFGTKRTSACALHMSAFDPKRTLACTDRAKNKYWNCDDDCSDYDDSNVTSIFESSIELDFHGLQRSQR
jgi:hypothetical protein